VVALDGERQVVMIHQYRHPVRTRLWELPAGLLDVHGEDPLVTAKRELAEEAGLAAQDWAVLVDVAASPGFTDENVRVYLATGLSAAQRLGPMGDEEDDLQVHRIPLHEAGRMVLAGEIVNAASVAGLLAAWAVLGAGGAGQSNTAGGAGQSNTAGGAGQSNTAGTAQPRPADTPWPGRPTAWATRHVSQRPESASPGD
jgi:8-oxo-dGTP pyrophosphatase MutT (NUDIX family)